jgi:hypothetical protein
VWERARREVQIADKISFVGLSVGSFMEPGLNYLFKGKTGIVSGVVANPDTVRFRYYANPFISGTPCGRILDLLCGICPGLSFNRSAQDDWGAARGSRYADSNDSQSAVSRREASEMTLRSDFAEFIRTEL